MPDSLEFAPLLSAQISDERFADGMSHAATPPFIRFSAVVETLVFLTVALLADVLFGNGTRFIAMPLHPFWMVVLLVTVQYGPREGVVAALLATAFLLVGNLPEQNLSETMYDYILRVSFLPLLWIVTALVLGSIRARQIHEKRNLENRLDRAEDAAQTIAKGYDAVKHAKEQLELRLADERRSLRTVYSIAKSLETTDSVEAMAGVEKLVRTALNPVKFSIFRWENGAFHLDNAYGWEKDDIYSRRFTSSAGFARELLNEKRTLSIANEQDEALFNGEGVIAAPIFDENTGKLYGMLKIEDIGFMDMNIRTRETIKLVCEWIAKVCVNVEKYQAAVGKQRPVYSSKPAKNRFIAPPPAHRNSYLHAAESAQGTA